MTNQQSADKHRKITELDESENLASNRGWARENAKRVGLVCPNCGAELQGRKCKLLCVRVGCGYVVTCSEW